MYCVWLCLCRDVYFSLSFGEISDFPPQHLFTRNAIWQFVYRCFFHFPLTFNSLFQVLVFVYLCLYGCVRACTCVCVCTRYSILQYGEVHCWVADQLLAAAYLAQVGHGWYLPEPHRAANLEIDVSHQRPPLPAPLQGSCRSEEGKCLCVCVCVCLSVYFACMCVCVWMYFFFCFSVLLWRCTCMWQLVLSLKCKYVVGVCMLHGSQKKCFYPHKKDHFSNYREDVRNWKNCEKMKCHGKLLMVFENQKVTGLKDHQRWFQSKKKISYWSVHNVLNITWKMSSCWEREPVFSAL